MPGVQGNEKAPPSELMIPAELKYDYMIYYIASKFGIAPAESGKCSEYEFRLCIAFEKIGCLTQKYFTEQNYNEQE